jgi:hypothetical protein
VDTFMPHSQSIIIYAGMWVSNVSQHSELSMIVAR